MAEGGLGFREREDPVHHRREPVHLDELLQAGRPAATWLTVNMAALLAARLQAADQWAAEVTREDEHARIVRSRRRYRESY